MSGQTPPPRTHEGEGPENRHRPPTNLGYHKPGLMSSPCGDFFETVRDPMQDVSHLSVSLISRKSAQCHVLSGVSSLSHPTSSSAPQVELLLRGEVDLSQWAQALVTVELAWQTRLTDRLICSHSPLPVRGRLGDLAPLVV